MNHVQKYMKDIAQIAMEIDLQIVEEIVEALCSLRAKGGRLFFLGVGGSAANCSHAVNDFRKLCDIESYTPVDNISELTARTNDEGWSTVFSTWLKGSRANENDAVFVLSVGGGDAMNNVSPNIISGLVEARKRGLNIYGIVGRDGGYTKKVGDAVLVIPNVDSTTVTPHTESFQSVILHCLVSHPKLRVNDAKWEGLTMEFAESI